MDEKRAAAHYKNKLCQHFNAWGNDYCGAIHEAPNLWSADVLAMKYNHCGIDWPTLARHWGGY